MFFSIFNESAVNFWPILVVKLMTLLHIHLNQIIFLSFVSLCFELLSLVELFYLKSWYICDLLPNLPLYQLIVVVDYMRIKYG